MDRRRWAIAMAVATSVIAMVLHVAWAHALNQRMPVGSAFLAAGAFALLIEAAATLGSLLAMWAALGGKPRPWRSVAGVAAVTMVSIVFGWVPVDAHPAGTTWPWWHLIDLVAFDTLITIVNATVPMFALRFAGLTVNRLDAKVVGVKPYRAQFSVRSLLQWTAGVAIYLSLLRFTFTSFSYIFARSSMLYIGGFEATSLAILWVVLGTKGRWPLRIVAGGLLGLGLGGMLWWTGNSGLRHAYFWRPVALHVLWMAASLWPFRWAGYRLIWRERVIL